MGDRRSFDKLAIDRETPAPHFNVHGALQRTQPPGDAALGRPGRIGQGGSQGVEQFPAA